jgi:hypothetical protein
MGNTWQTQEQKDFIDVHLAIYAKSNDGGTLNTVWPRILEKWFNQWPLDDPPAEVVEKEGSAEKAEKVWRAKRVEVSTNQQHIATAQTYLLNSRLGGFSRVRAATMGALGTSTLMRVSRRRNWRSRCT